MTQVYTFGEIRMMIAAKRSEIVKAATDGSSDTRMVQLTESLRHLTSMLGTREQLSS